MFRQQQIMTFNLKANAQTLEGNKTECTQRQIIETAKLTASRNEKQTLCKVGNRWMQQNEIEKRL